MDAAIRSLVVAEATILHEPGKRCGHRAQRFDLVALEPRQWVRLLTTWMYPPLRGTRFSVGQLGCIYTTVFIAPLGEYHAAGCGTAASRI